MSIKDNKQQATSPKRANKPQFKQTKPHKRTIKEIKQAFKFAKRKNIDKFTPI